ncbi:type II secretion system F family protein [Candidatus Parcubacteria bacterium]|nr:type II secretion system F family protein [Candidatus Parcubacteria bacterium]
MPIAPQKPKKTIIKSVTKSPPEQEAELELDIPNLDKSTKNSITTPLIEKALSKKDDRPVKKSTLALVWKKITTMGTVPLSEKMFFAENFRVMIKAGLSISEAMETLVMQTKNKKFKEVLIQMKDGVTKGNSLASMLQKFPKIFPSYFTNMVAVGEKSGKLEENLEQLAIQMKKDHDIRSKVRGAMIYPSVILVATFGITILMFVYVIPNVLSIFNELTIELPLATRILIAISNFLTNNGILATVGTILLTIGLITVGKTKKGKHLFHKIILHLWIIGPIAKKVNLARFSRTVSSLLKTDIPVIESFQITSTVLGNLYYKEACFETSEKLAKGEQINEALKQYPSLFPPLVSQMVSVGEKSGTTDVLLEELAEFYEAQVTEVTKDLSSIIEPILILFLGGVVGLIAFAVISPIYTLSENL